MSTSSDLKWFKVKPVSTGGVYCTSGSVLRSQSVSSLTEILRAERLQVRDVSTDSAMLQWRPVLAGLTGYYEIRFGPAPSLGVSEREARGPGTSPSTSGSHYQRLTQPGDSSMARLMDLKPDTTYMATLTPKSNLQVLNPLSVTFTTKPGKRRWHVYIGHLHCYN
jgi:hypothetical protein